MRPSHTITTDRWQHEALTTATYTDAVIGIDPGPTHTAIAWLTLDPVTIVETTMLENPVALAWITGRIRAAREEGERPLLAVEGIASYGMPVGRETFRTCYWIGRYLQAWEHEGGLWTVLPRLDVKLALCRSPRANDATIRQALIDRFGPQGTKKHPGATYGISGDRWSALAVAVTVAQAQ